MLSQYSGENKLKLTLDLDLIKVMTLMKHLKWYYKNIHPIITRLVKREIAASDINVMPMTKFLFAFIRKTSKCN